MSTWFSKYPPDIEAADPRFDETLQTVTAKTEQYVAGSVTIEGAGRAVRDAHAKDYGLVKAEVDILDRLPAEYAQGIYATPGRHDAPLLQRLAACWSGRAARRCDRIGASADSGTSFPSRTLFVEHTANGRRRCH